MVILFEDSHLLIISKPSGLTVNRSATTKDTETLFDWIERTAKWPLSTASVEFNDRRGVVHRLDKETSGVLIIAKDPESFINLQSQFKNHLVHKEYLALVHNSFDVSKPQKFAVDAPLSRNPRNRFKQAVVEGGREAVTDFEVSTNYSSFALVKAFPRSGRTHQIRVHLTALNHPVCGDKLYSSRRQYNEYVDWLEKNNIPPRMFLHSTRISFTKTPGSEMTVEAPLPSELGQILPLLKI